MPDTDPIRPGLFLALDGPDGAGKSTQVGRLACWLRSEGHDVVTCREPGGTDLGDRLRSLLLDRSGLTIGGRAEMFLFMASRAQLVEEVIRPARDAGKIVVCDRYLLSSLIYQGVAGGLPDEVVGRVGRIACNGVLPDLTIVIDVPWEVAQKRKHDAGGATDRIEARSQEYHERVRTGFLDASLGLYMTYYPAPIGYVDGNMLSHQVAYRIIKMVMPLIDAMEKSTR